MHYLLSITGLIYVFIILCFPFFKNFEYHFSLLILRYVFLFSLLIEVFQPTKPN